MPRRSQNLTSGLSYRQERAWVYIYMAMGVGNNHKLPPGSVDGTVSPPPCSGPPLINTDNGQTIPDLDYPSRQVHGTPSSTLLAFRWARLPFLSKLQTSRL